MVSEKITIHNAAGIHLRPAWSIAEEAMRYKSSVMLVHNEKKVNGKSLLSILSLGIRNGYEWEIQCEGRDEKEALGALLRVIRESEEKEGNQPPLL